MKRTWILFLAISFVLGIALPAMATHSELTAGDYAGGIGSSRHNLGSAGEHVTSTGTNATSEICVFCHTPHHAAGTGGTGAQPIWNRNSAVSTFTSYIFYRDGSSAPQPTYGSLACLSCHDGVTTWDALINRPGKGTSMGDMELGPFSEMATVMTSARLVKGVDLTDDHPISVDYKDPEWFDPDGDGYGAKASLRNRSTSLLNIDLSTINTGDPGNLWAVDGFITEVASINNLLKGVNRTVECSSCHDPHFKNKSNPEIEITYGAFTTAALTGAQHILTQADDGEVIIKAGGASNWEIDEVEVDGLFLRRVGGNMLSGVCRTCHAK